MHSFNFGTVPVTFSFSGGFGNSASSFGFGSPTEKINKLKNFLITLTNEELESESKFTEFVETLKLIPNYYRNSIEFDFEGKTLSFTKFLLEKGFYKLLPQSIINGFCEKNINDITRQIHHLVKNNTITNKDLFNIMRAINKYQSAIHNTKITILTNKNEDLTEKVDKTDYMLNKYFKLNFKNLIDGEFSKLNKKRKKDE
jgi:hypothetical protein